MARVAKKSQQTAEPESMDSAQAITADEAAEEPGKQQVAERRHQRGKHDGTTFYDKSRDLWRGALMLDGQRYRFSGKTERDVKRKMAEKRQEYYNWALTEPNKITVGQLVTDWLENVVKKRRRATTYSQYESPLRVYFLPRFGTKLARDLNARTLERFYAELEDGTAPAHYKTDQDGEAKTGRARRGRGLAAKSIRNLHTGLHAAFERAVRHRQIPRNPADGVELPSLPRRKQLPIDVDDLMRLLSRSAAEYAAETHDGYPLWVFLAHTGLRIGEALALRWANVDLDGGWFTVEEDLDISRKVGEVKTEAGYREVPLTTSALAALNEHKARQDEHRRALVEGYEDNDLVFATATGKPSSERNALRSLMRLTARAELGAHVTPHDFRRMCASLLVASGVDIATAAAIMGHKRASVLLDVYAQALRPNKRAAADKLQAALGVVTIAPRPALPAPVTAALPLPERRVVVAS